VRHTEGRLELSRGQVVDVLGEQLLLQGVALTSGSHPFGDMAAANTRRVVAAWNAVAGVPTDQLERLGAGTLALLWEELGQRLDRLRQARRDDP
jgi:hypothetical protein